LFTKSVSKLVPIPEEIKTLTFLAKETVIEGKMTFEGEFRFEGKFEGEMFGGGTLIVGETAVVKGKIRVDTIVINGLVEGEVSAKRVVKIHSTGKLYGTLVTPILTVNEGGILEGHCKMEGILNKEDDLHGEVLCEKN
jgi:cytoskeletal protein CcmA (bactofilin family)